MARFSSPLSHVTVAAPCPSDWDQMIGNERVRFCGQCSLNVYNLSSMTRAEAEAFIANNEGRLCVRFYRRGDGSILTKNCPVGLRAIRRRLSRVAQAVSTAVLSFFAGLGVYSLTGTRSPQEYIIMGDIAVTPMEMGEPVLQIQGQVVRPLAVTGELAGLPPPIQPAKSRRK